MHKFPKPYLEGYFACLPHEDKLIISPISAEVYRALENVVAEVNVPCNRPDADYCLIVMLIQKSGGTLAMEAVSLQNDACAIVDKFPDSFFSPYKV